MQSEKGEPENIIPASLRDAKTLQLMTMKKKKKKRHHEKNSCFNPYSVVGLDKFARMSAELSAKREYISRETGTPEAMVRFAYTSKGLVPVVLRTDYDGEISKLPSLSHPTTMQDSQFKQNQNPNPQAKGGDEGDHDVKGDEGCENGVTGFESRKEGETVIKLPWWSRWVPVVLKPDYGGGVSKLSSLLHPRTRHDSQFKENHNPNPQDEGDHNVKGDEGCENGVNGFAFASRKESGAVTILPWWSRYKETSALLVQKLSIILTSKFSVPAPAMAVFVLVGSLQTMCLGVVMGMKSFIDTCIFHFFGHLIYLKTSPEIRSRSSEEAEQVEKPLAAPEHKITNEEGFLEGSLISLRTLSNPTVRPPASFSASKNNSRSLNFNAGQKGRKKKKKTNFGRIFYIDDQPGKTKKFQQSEDFLGRAGRRPMDTTVGATLMAVILFVLLIYGRLCAIFFTSALLCVVPMLTNDENNADSGTYYKNSTVMMDLQSREYRKKVIMDGLLDRSHVRAKQDSQLIRNNM